MNLTLRFDEVGKNDVAVAGGKGASLGEMTRAGFPVPSGFVILTDAFDSFLKETDLNVEIDSILDAVDQRQMHTIEDASEKIQALIEAAEFTVSIAEKITTSFKNLGATYVAVRSSATAEDNLQAAWAGQLDSYLNTTEINLLDNVKKCWASLFSPRAIFYRHEKKLQKQNISVAVVVQTMIESEASGVAFSVHPVTQDKEQLIIEAAFGLGEALVSGQITPDSYVVRKDDWSILDKNINEQTKALIRDGDGNNAWVNLSPEKTRQQVLSDSEIIELSKIIQRLEKHYAFPVDVEWATEKGNFYILQSRPITTLTESDVKMNDKIQIGAFADYQRLFQVGAMPFIISDIFVDHYISLECLLLYSDKIWRSFLPKNVVTKTLQSGYELYGNEELFSAYQNGFKKYKETSGQFFEAVIKQGQMTEDQLNQFLDFTAQLFVYYSKTEFFYTDKAFTESEKNSILKKNLAALEDIKNSGRAYLNKIFFGGESYLSKALVILGTQFQMRAEDLLQYSREDLLALFHQKRLDEATVAARLDSYLMHCDSVECLVLDGDEANVVITSFLNQSLQAHGNIKGVSANKGSVRGCVKVILSGYDNFDQLKHVIEEMKQGDVLVAETTSPELIVACHKAGGIVTNQGGLMSHAAIVSREMNIPCIVGTGNATEILKDGDFVSLDGHNGIVTIINP